MTPLETDRLIVIEKMILHFMDMLAKVIVLLFCCWVIAFYMVKSFEEGKALNMPDWIVSIVTIVFMFFFRSAYKYAKQKLGEKNV